MSNINSYGVNNRRKIFAIIAVNILTVTGLTWGYQLTILAANSSIKIWDRITCKDIQVLRNIGGDFMIAFDPSHDTRDGRKPDHFDINVTLNDNQRRELGRSYPTTFTKFRFGTQQVQNNKNKLKFEAQTYSREMGDAVRGIQRFSVVNFICPEEPECNSIGIQDPILSHCLPDYRIQQPRSR